MKNELSANEAADLVGKSGKYLRARLRERKAAGTLDFNGAWQEPSKLHGTWKIRRSYMIVLAADSGGLSTRNSAHPD